MFIHGQNLSDSSLNSQKERRRTTGLILTTLYRNNSDQVVKINFAGSDPSGIFRGKRPIVFTARKIMTDELTSVIGARDTYMLSGIDADSGRGREFPPTFQGGKFMPVLVGIDGTGSGLMTGQMRDEEYDRVFANSFVKRLCQEIKSNRRYLRGPLLLGGDLVDAVVKGRRYVIERRQAGVNEPILLTGYSRGATGIVNVAMQLKDHHIPVAAMLLFDCVDMHLSLNAREIPDNVGPVLHVRRSPLSGSRPSWGNAATRHSRPALYREEFFKCTHGGMGGTPWVVPDGKSPNDFIVESGESAYRPPPPPTLGQSPDKDDRSGFGTNITYKQDKEVSEKVWEYVQPFLREHGFV